MTQKKDAKAWLKIILISCLALIIVGYAAFQARKIVEGPRLTLTSPTLSNTPTNDPLVTITGTASNIKDIWLNGNPIYIDEKGNFNEKLLLFSGYNIIELEARDKFNKETKKTIEVVYKG